MMEYRIEQTIEGETWKAVLAAKFANSGIAALVYEAEDTCYISHEKLLRTDGDERGVIQRVGKTITVTARKDHYYNYGWGGDLDQTLAGLTALAERWAEAKQVYAPCLHFHTAVVQGKFEALDRKVAKAVATGGELREQIKSDSCYHAILIDAMQKKIDELTERVDKIWDWSQKAHAAIDVLEETQREGDGALRDMIVICNRELAALWTALDDHRQARLHILDRGNGKYPVVEMEEEINV